MTPPREGRARRPGRGYAGAGGSLSPEISRRVSRRAGDAAGGGGRWGESSNAVLSGREGRGRGRARGLKAVASSSAPEPSAGVLEENTLRSVTEGDAAGACRKRFALSSFSLFCSFMCDELPATPIDSNEQIRRQSLHLIQFPFLKQL